jgi:hypothetical protein
LHGLEVVTLCQVFKMVSWVADLGY